MAIPVTRVHLRVAHATLPALLPTPPKWKMLLLLLPTPFTKPSRADSDERWDAHKTKSASTESSASSSLRSAVSIKNSAGCGSFPKNATLPPPKPGRADSAERWDAHKRAASPASSSSSSGTSSLASSSKWLLSRTTSAERWDVHKKLCPPRADLLDDGKSSSTSSNYMDTEEEEILWKPRAMYAEPGFAVAAPQPSMLPVTTAFLVPVA